MSAEREQRAAGEVERVVLGATAVPTDVPARVLIAPWGEVASANGTFVVDEPAGAAVLEAFREHGTDIPVDYEHQSLGGAYASPSGQAPAAGMDSRAGGVPAGGGRRAGAVRGRGVDPGRTGAAGGAGISIPVAGGDRAEERPAGAGDAFGGADQQTGHRGNEADCQSGGKHDGSKSGRRRPG